MPPPGTQPVGRLNVTSVSHFEVTIGGQVLGRFHQLAGLEMSFEVYDYYEGGNNEFVHRLPGRLRYPNLVLTYGMTDSKAMQQWFWKTHTQAERKEVRVRLMRDNITDALRTWTAADAYPVKWTGPTLTAGSSALAVEILEIAHAGLREV
jgi:phage tail-like protein